MKKLLLFLLLIVSASSSQAQDVIVKKDGSTVVCRVVEVNSSEIVYKKWTDLNGSNYVMNRTDASAINYQNGKRENLGEMTNLYAPNNQNTGAQMVNDKALLAIDATTRDIPRQAKTLRLVGLIGGIAIIGGGVAFACTDDDVTGIGLGIAGGGVLFATGFMLAAQHQIKKHRNYMASVPLYQKDVKFANGSSLTAGVDMLKDRMLNNQTIGVGLSYNF